MQSSVYTLHIRLIAPSVHVNYYWYIQLCSSSSARTQQFLYLTTVHSQSGYIIFCLLSVGTITYWHNLDCFLITSSCCFNTNTMSVKVQSSLQLLQKWCNWPLQYLKTCINTTMYLVWKYSKWTQGLFKLRLEVAAVHSHFIGCSLYCTLVLFQFNVQIWS